MCFDDPIFLDRESFEDLIQDTLQHRMCWMYHDILSDNQVARMFDYYAGNDTPGSEAYTTTTWVAAGRQADGFYLLFKLYPDFYGPPERCNLYYIECPEGLDGEVHIRYVNMAFQNKLNQREKTLVRNMWGKISENTSYFFGESGFDSNIVPRFLQMIEKNAGHEVEAFDHYAGATNDGEKFLLCNTIAAYFQGIQAIKEFIYNIVVYDGGSNDVRQMHTKDLLDMINRISDSIDCKRLSEYIDVLQGMGQIFCQEPLKYPVLSRGAGRALFTMTEDESLSWVGMTGRAAQHILREFYLHTAPRQVWDVFHRWQGEILFTVVKQPFMPDIYRGIYLLTRFEDHTGMDVTNLFWLENSAGGSVHLCQGDFFEELLDFILRKPVREAVIPGSQSIQGEHMGSRGYSLFTKAFEKYGRTVPILIP